MKDNLNIFFNGRRPQFLEMEDDLIFLEIEDDLNFLKMEDDLICFKMEDDLNFLENGRRLKFFGKWKKKNAT